MNLLLEQYLKNPCRTLSIPYHKFLSLKTSPNLDIYHDLDCFDQSKYFQIEKYFRIINNLKKDYHESKLIHTVEKKDLETLLLMINDCYNEQGIVLTETELEMYQNKKVYQPSLWIAIKTNQEIIASGIAEYDQDLKEGVLEWIQVLPKYQKQGYGKIIVISLLARLKKFGAEFVTVSGKLDSSYNPLSLYQKCDFHGDDIWYICYKKF